MSKYDLLALMINDANNNYNTKTRLKDWEKIIQWNIDGEDFFWSTSNEKISFTTEKTPDLILSCSENTLKKIAHKELSFFSAVYDNKEIDINGSLGDAIRLGYIFLYDKRKQKVIFISNCWLNDNMRYPGGAAHSGGDTSLIKFLLDNGCGIIQMPCPEYNCLGGLEKEKYGIKIGEEAVKCYRKTADQVVNQIKEYKKYGYNVVGILGMNPSPSCGVEISRIKWTIDGTNPKESPVSKSGVFIDQLRESLKENGINDIKIFGLHRLLIDEVESENRFDTIKEYIQ